MKKLILPVLILSCISGCSTISPVVAESSIVNKQAAEIQVSSDEAHIWIESEAKITSESKQAPSQEKTTIFVEENELNFDDHFSKEITNEYLKKIHKINIETELKIDATKTKLFSIKEPNAYVSSLESQLLDGKKLKKHYLSLLGTVTDESMKLELSKVIEKTSFEILLLEEQLKMAQMEREKVKKMALYEEVNKIKLEAEVKKTTLQHKLDYDLRIIQNTRHLEKEYSNRLIQSQDKISSLESNIAAMNSEVMDWGYDQ